VRAEALDYCLPDRAVAQQPVEPRDAARLLVDAGPGRAPDHRHVRDLPALLGPGDLVVVNTSRVLPARLVLRKPTGGRVEVLLLEPVDRSDEPMSGRPAPDRPVTDQSAPDQDAPDQDVPDGAITAVGAVWEALVRPGRRVGVATVLVDDHGTPQVEVGGHLDDGRRLVRLLAPDPEAALARLGAVPLPPYIHEPLADPDRYQTVFAQRAASVAAPTAGLHLTDALLAAVEATGARIAGLELAIGLDTFRPVVAERLEDHLMHSERYRIEPATWEACAEAGRVVAVGTTVVRALESAARRGELAGRTDLLIAPGHAFAVVDALLTNFHLPRSTLLAMVEAFIGPRWRFLYDAALREGYRFLSFGDAMFLPVATPGATS
jgi:S-adenosylmethionine:tRNA ribosyltransferase-isomerase